MTINIKKISINAECFEEMFLTVEGIEKIN